VACAAAYTTPILADGTHTLDVRAKDGNGNVDSTPAHYGWTLDTVAPDTTISTYPANPSNAATGSFTFSSDEIGAVFQCSLDAAAFAPCPDSYTTPALVNGSHTLAVRALDVAGNVDATPASYTWMVSVP
jgi:hypothetical protein